jgi:fatty-acyl-CoA synthase
MPERAEGVRPARLPSYASGPGTAPLIEHTIGTEFDRIVAEHGDRPALVDRPTSRRWTFRELAEEVDALAGGLLGLGVARGDRVGLWAMNRAEWVVVQYACAKIGAVLVNLNPSYGTHELEFVLNLAGVRVLVSEREFKTSDYAGMIDAVRPVCPALEHVVFMDGPEWTELLDRGRGRVGALERRAAELAPGDPINIQFTSGTTGFPKGATLSHRNILNNGFFVGELCEYTPADRVCVPVPFFHCFGMVMGTLAAMTHGACVVVTGPVFSPRAVLSAVRDERCTSLYGVPAMFIAELALPEFGEYDLSSLRTGIMSGSPCPVEVMRQVIDLMGMAGVTICYGMTETSPVATQTRADDALDRRVSTVGRPGPHIEVKVADPRTGQPVRRGEPGEVCMRGYSVMLGYWDQPEKTAEAIDEDGWMHSGDLGVMDDRGYVSITGRIKDMVIRGGENIYPREVEEFLHTHPDVLDVQVVGVPDPMYGEELMAWLRLRDGASLDREAVRRFCAGRLARNKIPRYVQVVDVFPMTVSGKVRKVELRERGRELLERRSA